MPGVETVPPSESIAVVSAPSRFNRDVVRVAGGNIGAQALLWIASPFLTRLYAPEDFGVMQVVVATAGSLNLVTTLRYEMAIPLPASDRDAGILAIVCLVLNVLATIALAGAVLVFGPRIARALGLAEGAVGALWFLPVVVFAGGITQVVEAWTTRVRAFSDLARYRMTTTWSGVIAQLGAASIGLRTPSGLLLGKAVGPLAATLRIASGARSCRLPGRARGSADRPHALRRARELALRYRAFPLWNTWASLANFAGTELPTWVLAFVHDPAAAGWFALATFVLRAPVQLLGNAVARVFLGEGARAVREGRLGELAERTVAMCSALGIVPAVLALCLGREIIVIFGENWRESGVYIEILAPAVFLRFVGSPISQIFALAERQRAQVAFQLAQCGFVFLAVSGASFLGSPRWIIGAFAIAVGAKYLFFSWWLLGVAGADRLRAAKRVLLTAARALPLALVLLASKWAWDASALVLFAEAAAIAPLSVWWIARELRDRGERLAFDEAGRT